MGADALAADAAVENAAAGGQTRAGARALQAPAGYTGDREGLGEDGWEGEREGGRRLRKGGSLAGKALQRLQSLRSRMSSVVSPRHQNPPHGAPSFDKV